MNELKTAIAQHLTNQGIPTEEDAIVKIVEMYKVYNVVVAGRPARFVSKAKVDALRQPKTLAACTWTLEASMRRQEGKKWVARIDGTCKELDGLRRTFLSAQSIEWGKYGMRKAVFEIQEPGYYQDSDGDYFRAFIDGDGIDAVTCSKLEVLAHFGKVKV